LQKYKQLGRTRHHKKKPLGDAKLGKLIGIKGDALGCYERGEVTPSIKMAVRIAQALEVSLDWLVFGGQANPEEALSDRELIALFKKVQGLSSTQQATVKDFLQAFVFKAGVQEQLANS
jgi:transcriptional regulator with XRE-family HTH domain